MNQQTSPMKLVSDSTAIPEGIRLYTGENDSLTVHVMSKNAAMQAVGMAESLGYKKAVGIDAGNGEYDIHFWGRIDTGNH